MQVAKLPYVDNMCITSLWLFFFFVLVLNQINNQARLILTLWLEQKSSLLFLQEAMCVCTRSNFSFFSCNFHLRH